MEIAWRNRRRSAMRMPTKVGRYQGSVYASTARMHRPTDLEQTATPFCGPA